MIVNEYGYIRLATAIIERAVDDYKSLLRRQRKAKLIMEKRRLDYDVEKFEKDFFKGNPIMGILPVTSDEVIIELKSQINKEFEESEDV